MNRSPFRRPTSRHRAGVLSLLLASLAAGAIVASCAARSGSVTASQWEGVETRPFLMGFSVNGRPIEGMVMGEGPDVSMVLATIHGNENAGTPLTYQLARHLEANPALLQGRKVILVPVINPDGYADNRRFNARGIDLNRNFPADNRENTPRYGMQALSEPESRIIEGLLRIYAPQRIVSMHEPLQTVDWDGPGRELAEHMARYTNLPVEKVGARPGSLGSYAGETLGIPIITLEFPRGAGGRPHGELWSDYGRSLLAFITYPHEPPALR